MKKILLAAKKELYRFFCDRRMVISALVFPFVFLYLVYGFFVPLIVDLIGSSTNAVVYTVNLPPVIRDIFEQLEITPIEIEGSNNNSRNIENIMQGITGQDGSFLIIFPENFIEDALLFDAMHDEHAPEVHIFFNSLASGYTETYTNILAALTGFEKSIARKFDINLTSGGDLAQAGAAERILLSAILPMFLLMFIFQGAMATTTEAITGEKERGTFAAIFLTSITPMELSIGKISGLGFQAFLCGVSASMGMILAFPRFIMSFAVLFNAAQPSNLELQISLLSLNQYNFDDLGLLIIVLLSTAVLIVSLIAAIAINAKTAKEAQLFIYPIIIVVLFTGFLTSFANSNPVPAYHYLIPIYNSLQSIGDIISLSRNPLNIAITAGSNLTLAAFACFVLSRLIKPEKVIGG